jgi:predicted secreted hydrolase
VSALLLAALLFAAGGAPPSAASPTADASVDTASVDTASVGTASVDTASVGTASVGTASVGTASVGTASVGTASVGTASAHKAASADPVDTVDTATTFAAVTPGRALAFPRDYGSHPDYRTEWWYVTGWLTAQDGESLGFQITFFRSRPHIDPRNPSAFAPRQLLIAHCALSDPRRGRLWQDQRIRRAGLTLAEASPTDTDVYIDDWTLKRTDGVYRARIAADEFELNLDFTETQPPMLNGDAGESRKGPDAGSASYYYSLPHLKVSGTVIRGQAPARVTGEAWLDHEWSSEYLDAQSTGWDWIGINLDDGSALMAFRIRGLHGDTRWAGASLRGTDGRLQSLGPAEVTFDPQRDWTSPRTGIRYPVQWRVTVGPRVLELRPLLDDQENDTRLSTGAIYWEGAVRAYEGGAPAGRGYLELTGYGEKLTLR